MAAIIDRFTGADGEFQTAVDGLFFSRKSAPSQPLRTAQWPCFALVAQGAKSLTLGGQEYHYGVGNYLVVALDLPVASRVTQASHAVPNLGLGMAIRAERLKELLDRAGPARPRVGGDARGVSVNTAAPDLLDATLRLLRLLDRLEDIAVMAPLIEQEILYRLLAGPCGSALMRIAQADSPGNKVAKAIAWLRGNFTGQLRMAELAAHVGMSTSSLHHHFRAVAAMTPLQYQKQLRLHEARRLMLVERLDVGAAGFRVGYQSPSQFSREYRRLYGVSPLRDREGGIVERGPFAAEH
jgi:AraC-like DNA-binding protein